MPDTKPYRMLLLEDRSEDAWLIEFEVKKTIPGGEFTRVETRPEFEDALETLRPDIILSDYSLPSFDGLQALRIALESEELYDVICLDIMLSEMDGQTVLKRVRKLERAKGIKARKGSKIVVTTALSDYQNANKAYRELCDGYLVKPIEKTKLQEELRALRLIPLPCFLRNSTIGNTGAKGLSERGI